jgi:hypothetical protein
MSGVSSISNLEVAERAARPFRCHGARHQETKTPCLPPCAQRRLRGMRRVVPAVLVVLLTAVTVASDAPRARRAPPPQSVPPGGNSRYDGRFLIARLKYVFGFGGFYYRGIPAWQHGYPQSEQNLLQIAREITLLRPSPEASKVLAIDDPELFHYPVSYMVEAGYWEMTDKEAVALRAYLLKGGFLILDDSRDGFSPGNMGWANIAGNFARVFPELHWIDLSPSHPIFHAFFDINSFDVVKNYYDRGPPVFRALFVDNDPTRHMLVMSNFNTDVSNYWEFSANGFTPVDESNQAYELGVNYLVYALTH